MSIEISFLVGFMLGVLIMFGFYEIICIILLVRKKIENKERK